MVNNGLLLLLLSSSLLLLLLLLLVRLCLLYTHTHPFSPLFYFLSRFFTCLFLPVSGAGAYGAAEPLSDFGIMSNAGDDLTFTVRHATDESGAMPLPWTPPPTTPSNPAMRSTPVRYAASSVSFVAMVFVILVSRVHSD